jgi:NADH-quinone oxidoreductase subunit H
MNTVTMSAVIVTLFFGGPAGPTFGLTGWFPDYVLGFTYFFAKLFVFLFIFVWFRATLPRLRYDQLMDLGWKLLIPVALGWFLIVAALKVAVDAGWNIVVVLVASAAGLLTGGLLLRAAVRSGQEAREDEFAGGGR